jgi:hypothetical protein
MIFNPNFSKIFPKIWDEFGQNIIAKSSKSLSLYSDLPNYFYINKEFIKRPFSSVCVLLVLNLLSHNGQYEEIEDLRNKIWKNACSNNFEGDWLLVKEIIQEDDPFSAISTVSRIIFYYGEHTIFGNMFPIIKRIIKNFKIHKFTSENVLLDKRPVKEKVWKRGYNDKGSLIPLHKKFWPIGQQISEEEILEEQRNKEQNIFPARFYYLSQKRKGNIKKSNTDLDNFLFLISKDKEEEQIINSSKLEEERNKILFSFYFNTLLDIRREELVLLSKFKEKERRKIKKQKQKKISHE